MRKEIGITQKLIEALKNLYNNNNNIIRVGTNNKYSNAFKTTKGLQQGCLKIFLEQILKPRKKKSEGMGIPIRDDFLCILSFADNQVVTAQDKEDLSYMFRNLEKQYIKNGLEINLPKTEYLKIEQEPVRNLEMVIGNMEDREINGTENFKYLGFII
ncbi:uncharacterized protein [Diabrotica undecimpunctata]|uniref:uncharacterized protein n=1 Tax=Diabrotica undecimpunctata TaxID=50387 RepID=UPI003B63552C